MNANWLYQSTPVEKKLATVCEYVVFDTETTGLKAEEEEIIEISALKISAGTVIGQYSSLIKPHKKLEPFISELTGITDEMLENGAAAATVIPEFRTFIGNNILIGHNVSFDIKFLNTESRRLNLPPLANQFIDTLQIARLCLPDLKHHRLQDLSDHFGFHNEAAHRAWGDSQATYQLFLALAKYQVDNNIILKKRCAVRQVTNDHQNNE